MNFPSSMRAIKATPEARGMTPREYYEKFIVSKVPLKRETTVADVGHAVVFFVSEDCFCASTRWLPANPEAPVMSILIQLPLLYIAGLLLE